MDFDQRVDISRISLFLCCDFWGVCLLVETLSSLWAFLRDFIQYNYSVSEIVEHYEEWVSEVNYMILSRWNRREWKNDIFAVKCAKRGNDVYQFRVNCRFKGLSSMAGDAIFFNEKDRGKKKTSALWVTLTYNVKHCSFREAWQSIGVEFNRFSAFVRKKYGKVACCRVFESFENGYPHVHCILLFEEKSFTVFRDGRGNFRIHEKNVFANGWHSNIDVKGMSSLKGGFRYLGKYLTKCIDYEKADSIALKTLALYWVFRKRAFSVSGLFRKLLHDLIRNMHNSNHTMRQTTLIGVIIEEERFFVIGFVPADVVRLKGEVWFTELNTEQINSVDDYLSNSEICS